MQGPQMLRVDDVHRGDEGIPWIVRGDENREMPIFFSLFPTRHVIVGIKAVESPDQSPLFLCREFEERRICGHALTARGLDPLARSIILPMMKRASDEAAVFLVPIGVIHDIMATPGSNDRPPNST